MAISKEDYLEGYSKAFDLIQNARSKEVIKSTIGSFINSTNELMGKYFLTNFETDGVIAMVSCVDEKIHRVFPNMRIFETDPKACNGQMFMLAISEPKEEPINGQGADNVLPLSEEKSEGV